MKKWQDPIITLSVTRLSSVIEHDVRNKRITRHLVPLYAKINVVTNEVKDVNYFSVRFIRI